MTIPGRLPVLPGEILRLMTASKGTVLPLRIVSVSCPIGMRNQMGQSQCVGIDRSPLALEICMKRGFYTLARELRVEVRKPLDELSRHPCVLGEEKTLTPEPG